jgi:hypothetical protein
MVLYELRTGCLPYGTLNSVEIADIKKQENGTRPENPPLETDDPYYYLYMDCTEPDPEYRVKIDAVVASLEAEVLDNVDLSPEEIALFNDYRERVNEPYPEFASLGTLENLQRAAEFSQAAQRQWELICEMGIGRPEGDTADSPD